MNANAKVSKLDDTMVELGLHELAPATKQEGALGAAKRLMRKTLGKEAS